MCQNKATSQIGNNVRARVFNAGLLTGSQFASGRSCDRPTRSSFPVVFLDPRPDAELISKYDVTPHASHGAFPTLVPCSDFFLCNKIDFVSVLLPHFPTLYPHSDVPLPEGLAVTTGNRQKKALRQWVNHEARPPSCDPLRYQAQCFPPNEVYSVQQPV
jgi:hypothetical protein